MEKIDRTHEAVDLSSGNSIAGAVGADVDTRTVLVRSRHADGTEEEKLMHFGGGIRIVRRR